MLIRSQSREQIVNLDNYNGIAINYQGEHDFHVCAVLEMDAERISNVMLGNYSTKENATRVLDMIQKEYEDYGNNGVFQMPQDSGVEIWENSEKNAQTRIKRIRSMSAEELADKILASNANAEIDFCQNISECDDIATHGGAIPDEMCRKCMVKWLNSPEVQQEN